MKNVVLACIFLCISAVSFAQTTEQCGEEVMRQKMMRIYPNYAAESAQLEQKIQQFIQNQHQSNSLNNGFTIDTTVTYTIPIVFHVIHTGGSVGTTYNPSTANINALLAKLNDDWSNGAGNGVDFKIQFALAQRDESCASTTGIERINGSSLTNYVTYGVNASGTSGVKDSTLKALSDWSRDSYVNVWIVNKIDGSDGTSGSFTAGYAYIPPTYSYLDGIVILATQTNGSSSTLSHEMGHFFSLYHTFQGDGTGSTCPSDADCGTNGDCCADTPPMKRSSSTCPTYTTTCSGTPFNNVYYNFMDYSSCRDRFTSDQRERVRAALATYRPGLAVNSGTTTAPTTPATSACTPGITNVGNGNGMGPVDVAFDVYDNTTYDYTNDGTPYKDYSCLQEYPVNAGQTYSISVTTSTNSQLVRVYVDYNNNGTLNDSGELVFSSNASGAPHTHTGTFTIPSSGVTTNTPIRMRVWADYLGSTSYGPCGNLQYGQAEDYSLVVTPAPASITTGNVSSSYCAGASISVPFTASGTINSGNVYTAQLSNSSGSFSSPVSLGTITSTASSGNISGTIPSNTTTGSGYKVRVIASNPSTTGSSSSAFSITAQVTPAVSITTSTTTICSGTSVTLSVSSSSNGGGSPTYQWYKNGSSISGATSTSYTTTTLANHDSVWVVMTSNLSCVSTATATSNKVTFTVNSTVTPLVSISASATTVCAGTSVTFTASPTNGGGLPLYDWYKNGTITLSTLSATYSTTGLSNHDSVWVVMTSSAGCPSPSTATSNHVVMTVNPMVTPSATISTSTTTICSGTSVTMTTTPTNGGSSPTYQWYKDGSSISGATSSSYTTSSIANHDSLWVVMTSNATCASPTTATSNKLTFTVTGVVTPAVNVSVTSSQTICPGGSVSFEAYPVNGGSSPTYQWYKNSVSISGATSSSYTGTGFSNNDTVWVVMTSSASCASPTTAASTHFVITVNPTITPSVTISANNTTICAGGGVTFTTSPTNGGGAPSYQWYKNGSAIGSATSSTYFTTGLANHDSVWVVMTSTASCVSPTTATSNHVVMTVNPTVTPSASISTSTTTICSGTSVTMTATPTNGGSSPTYQWYQDGSSISGATSSSYTTSGILDQDSLWVVMTSNASCASPTTATSNKLTYTVTSLVTPVVNATVTNSQTICPNDSVSFVAFPGSGAGSSPTYQWYKNGSAISGATSTNYTGTGFSNNDSVWVVMTSNASCASPTTATSTHFVITVNPTVTPSISISTSSTSICAGSSVHFGSLSAYGGSPSFQWYKNGTAISGATSASYNSSSLSDNDSIWVVMTSTAACASPTTATSNHVVMTVNPLVTPSVSIVANNTTICSGSSVTFTATPTNGGSSPSYQWYKNSASISGATSSTYTTSSLANGDTVWVVMTSNASCRTANTATSNHVTITVNSSLVPAVSIVSNQGDTICQNQIVVFISTVTNGGSAPTYQWYKNGTAVSGATNSTYPNTSLANHDSIWVVVTSSETCASPTTATSNHIVMTVNPPLTTEVAITASNTTVCAGSNVTFTATPTNGGTSPSYQWYKNGSTISGATSSTYSTTGLADNDSIWVFMLSNAVCPYPTGRTSNHIVMTVNPLVTPSATISTASTSICSGTSVTMTATPTNGGSSPTYQWYQDGSSISGATSSSYTTSGILDQDSLWVVMTSNANCASPTTATSNKLTYTVTGVVAPSFLVTITNSSTICPNDTVKFRVVGSANGGSMPSFHWYINGNQVAGVDSTVYNGTGFANHDTVWAVMTSNAACASPNTDTSSRYVITVNPNVTPSVSVSANNSTVCIGSNVTFTATPTNGGSSPTYQWYKNGSMIVGATSSTYSTVSLANNDSVWVVMTSNANCALPTTATSNHVIITVNQLATPSVTASANVTAICTGGSVTFTATPTNGGSSPSYQWFINNSDITGATASTFTTSALVNGDSVWVLMTSNASCIASSTASSNAIHITVNSTLVPSVSITSNSTTICVGTPVVFTSTATNGGASPTYQWYKNGTLISGATSANYGSSSLANNDSVWVVMTSSAGCASPTTATSNHVVMTVNPNVNASVSLSASATMVCAGSSVTFTASPTNGGSSPGFVWYKNGSIISGATSSTYSSTGLANNDSIWVVMTSNATCATPATATSNHVVMTVNPVVIPVVDATASNTTACSGVGVTFTATPTSGGGASPTYQWYKGGSPVIGATNSTFSASSLAGNFTVYVKMTSSDACALPTTDTSNHILITVVQYVTPTVSISANDTVACVGNNVSFGTNITNGGSSPTYVWYKNGSVISGVNTNFYQTTTLADQDSVWVEMTSNATCASPATVTSNHLVITVNPTVTPVLTISANSTTICAGDTVTFTGATVNGGNSPSYAWYKNGVHITGANQSTYTTSNLSNHDTITATIESNAACPSPAVVTSNPIVMTVNASVVPTVQAITANSHICAGDDVYFTTARTHGGSSPTYQWYKNNTPINGAHLSSYLAMGVVDQDSFYVEMTSSATCPRPITVASSQVVISVTPTTPASVSISVSQNNVCEGSSVTFTATPTYGGSTPTYQWYLNGNDINGADSATFTTSSLANNDSIYVEMTSSATCPSPRSPNSNSITMSFLPVLRDTVTTSICQGQSYEGYTATGTYMDTTTGSNGCDSIRTLHLTVLPIVYDTITTNICSGQSYAGHDTTGTYTDTYTGSNGCDSVRLLNLIVQSVVQTNINRSVCQGQTYAGYGTTGTYVDTFTAQGGCDSIRTLNLTILSIPRDTINQTVCQGQTYAGYGTAGTYVDTFAAANGCDSIRTLNLTVSPPLTSSTNESICQGDSYNFNGQVLTVAGTYSDTLQTSGGCDSIATVVLSIIAPSTYSFSDSICQGSSYAFGGQTLTTGGTYTDTITAGSGSGCDSIVTLTLVIKQPTSSTVNAAICTGNTYSFNGQTLDTTGTYQATLTGSNGCDSVVTLNLQVQSVLTTSLNESICQGGSYTFGGQTLTTAGTYMDTLSSSGGCDSVVTLNLQVQSVLTSSLNESICQGGSYTFGGQTLTTAGTYMDTLSTTGGCDSVVTLNLTITPGYSDTTTQTICPGDTFAGHSTSGVYVDSLVSIGGCDSINTLILTVSGPAPTITQTGDTLLDAGNGYISYQWFLNDTLIQGAITQTLTIAGDGIYTVQVINLDGCVITSAADTVLGVGIDQIDVAQGISIYPNPANDVLNVVLKNHQTYLLDIVNVEGKVLISDKIATSSTIDVKQLAAGVYLLRLHDEKGYTITKRFVKAR